MDVCVGEKATCMHTHACACRAPKNERPVEAKRPLFQPLRPVFSVLVTFTANQHKPLEPTLLTKE